jgi:rSAM/selenodomain-associated transferase 1
MSALLVVFAKAPRPGEVKTRLCPPFSPAEAAAFYTHLLDDVLEHTAEVAPRLGLETWLAVHPPEAVAVLARRAPAGLRVVAQRGANLSERMAWAVAQGAAAGCSPILLRGSDSPTLGEPTLREALAELARTDLVICPDRDGGYNLVGLHRPAPTLFEHPMSTRSVLEDTLANARGLGLSTRLLPPGFDIDEAKDLLRLAEERDRGRVLICPRTLAFLDAGNLWHRIASGVNAAQQSSSG